MIDAKMQTAKWVTPPKVDKRAIDRLTTKLNLPTEIARLLAIRGHTTIEGAKLFLRPRLEYLHDPFLMNGMIDAVDRIVRAINERETVMVHGDYDVDGICSTTILVKTIRALGGVAIPFIPNRMSDGYDLGPSGVRQAVRIKASLVVTCDCGTSAVSAVSELRDLGVDTIITDHHLPGGDLPDALAILNPRKPTCEYPDKDLAAVSVAFKLALALAATMDVPDAFIWRMLDLVALATIADIAPLKGENRILVRYGIRMMAETQNIGLQALMRESGMEGKTVTAGRLGFTMAPRLNAVGRIGSALMGVELLMADSRSHAASIAREIESLNYQRQAMDRRVKFEACEMVEALNLDETYGIVLASPEWHPGVIGIAASKIVEQFGRPAFLIALEDGVGKGSGRSISSFDLHAALLECKDHLIKFGGHKAAAGLTIDQTSVKEFTEQFNEVARQALADRELLPEIRIDAEIDISEATDEFDSFLKHFEPYGVGNPAPVFVSRGVRLAGSPRIVGRDTLKVQIATEHGHIDAIGWGMGRYAEMLNLDSVLDICYRLERDDYRGYNKLQAKLSGLEIIE